MHTKQETGGYCMNQWKAQIQINGEEYTRFIITDIEVSDEIYRKIQNAIATGQSLNQGEICQYFEDNITVGFDAVEYLREDFDELPPDSNDYDSDEEYEEAVEEYEEALEEFEEEQESIYEDCCLESIIVYDPGDELRFKKRFIGRICSKEATGELHNVNYEFDYCGEVYVNNKLTVCFSENGTIVDIKDIYAEGLQGETMKYSDWSECFPLYDFLTEEFENKICC